MVELDRQGVGAASGPPAAVVGAQLVPAQQQVGQDRADALRASVAELREAVSCARSLSQRSLRVATRDLPEEELAAGALAGNEEPEGAEEVAARGEALSLDAIVGGACAELWGACRDLRVACERVEAARQRANQERHDAQRVLDNNQREARVDAARREAQIETRRESFEADARTLEPSLAQMRARLEAAEAEARLQARARVEEVERCQQLLDRVAGRDRLVACLEKQFQALHDEIAALKGSLQNEKHARMQALYKAALAEQHSEREARARVASERAGQVAACPTRAPDSFPALAFWPPQQALARKEGRSKRPAPPKGLDVQRARKRVRGVGLSQKPQLG